MARNLAYLAALATLALLSTWLLWTVQASLQERQTAPITGPTLTIDRLQATRLDRMGVRDYTLTSERVEQLSNALGNRLHRPVIETFSDGRQREWRLQAEQGWVAADSSLIRLEHGVTLTRPASSGKLPVTITTRELLIRPASKTLETTAPVRMETPNGVLSAVGLKGYFDDQRLELLSEVQGSYAPPKL